MSEWEHTPGPWMTPHFADDNHRCNCHYVLSDHQWGMGSIATVHSQCEKREDSEHYEPVERAKANARLIAAAPELLAALELFDRCAYPVAPMINPRGHNWMPEKSLDYALEQARLSLARANGVQAS